jgi:hypothetical protein
MPKNNSASYLNDLAAYNQLHGITATFSEMKKTARRMQTLHETMPDGWRLTVEDYFRQVSDPTGEEATDNVMHENELKERAHHASVRRRLAAAA